MNDRIPYRQIHMDFHTNATIPGVGSGFDRAAFGETLKRARVNSINLFGKCHHGLYYYPTEIGTMHPSLGFDLLGEQIAACREHGIRAQVYTCVAWNEDWADRHPEWLCVNHEGIVGNKRPFDASYYKWNSLCVNNPEYRKLIKAELREMYDRYHPDGFWIDLVVMYECVCPVCRAEMLAMGMEPSDIGQVRRHDRMAEIAFCKDVFEYLQAMDPSLDIYFNSHPASLDNAADPEASSATKRAYYTCIDIESLPSDGWGYDHFPMDIAYVGKYPLESCMMNGKFHFSWGDFGSLRNKQAMEYECFRAIAHGARVCMGDQLHPTGRIDPVVYGRIGEVFASVAEKEPWLHGTKKCCEVGAFLTSDSDVGADTPLIDQGVYQVLSELHIPFDYLNRLDDLAGYRLLILPDAFAPDGALAQRLEDFVRRGGKLLLTGRGGVKPDGTGFAPPCVKAEFLGDSAFSKGYVRLDAGAFPDLPAIDHVLYERACRVAPGSGESALAHVVEPYFERTYNRFCSHRQTPPRPEPTAEPAILEGDGYIYIAAPLFSDYALNRGQVHRGVLAGCIARLLPDPLIESDLPAITELTLRQSDARYVLHLLNYVIQRRAKRIDTIEERFTVPRATVRLRLDAAPRSAALVPSGQPVDFRWEDGVAVLELRDISGHTMLALEKQP